MKLAVALVAAAAAALAQEAPPGVPDAPAGDGTLRGRVVHEAGGEAVSGLPVVLYALSTRGDAGLRGSTTDGEGRFEFTGIATDPEISYLVGIRFGGVPFAARAVFAPGERERTVEVRVSEPTADPSDVATGTVRIRLDRSCGELRAIESVELRNAGTRVIYAEPGSRASVEPVFRTRLPEGANDFQTPLGTSDEGWALDGRDLRFYGPVYPGTQELRYAYGVPVGGDPLALTRRFTRGAQRVEVLTHEAGPTARGAGLSPSGGTTVEGAPYRILAAEDVAPDAELAFTLSVPESPEVAGLSVERAQIWLEVDDAALVVDEQHQLAVEADAPLVARSDAPLLCLPLPAGAEEVRFATDSLELGLAPTPSGALAVHGPLPPGTTALALRYRLPADAGGADFERTFSRPFPLLSVFVADTGVLPHSDRLHRRRPVRSADRNYIALEAFDVGAGETIALDLRRIPAPSGGSRVVGAAFLAVAGVAAVLFLGAPLRGQREERAAAEAPEVSEREAVYAALRDLEEDFETGKLSAEDHAVMRQELRARAAELLRAERSRREEAETPAETEASGCPSCGAPPPEDALFCPRCGKRLAS